ncbi:MAG TPA: hypothetical protein VF812_00880 [Ktedonobacterales bacterium]
MKGTAQSVWPLEDAPSARAGGSGGAGGWLTRRREVAVVAALIALAALLRLTLAARGWPILNSDEATMGLMGSDVLRLGTHPVFTYAQDYIGALQAYLAAPIDALLGPTPLALRVTTTLQFTVFLLVVYALARAIWSPAVGLVSLEVLALGPEWALLREAQAGAGAQDTLVFGALVVWLAFSRLGSTHGRRRALALDAAFGLAVGLGLWGDFLFLPYVAAALLALACLGLRDWRAGALRPKLALGEVALGVVGFLIGASPFILANISSGGQTLRHAVALAQAHNGAAAPGLSERLALLVGQIGATLLVGLPQALGSATVCPTCAVWPAPNTTITPGALAQELLFAAPFSLLAIGLWLWTAWPLARDTRRTLARILAQRVGASPRAFMRSVGALPPLDQRWWGRLMLALGAALTLLQYVVSRTSYTFPASSARYLIGLYACAPLMAAPLVAASGALWRWVARGRMSDPAAPARATSGAILGAALLTSLLVALLAINAAGAAHALATTSDREVYGQPMGQRDARLVAFLRAHSSASFYAGYWTCLRLVFISQQQVSCLVISQYNAFTPGFNRYTPAVRRVQADPHPAWVFDLKRQDEAPTVPAQVAACERASEPRCAGYTSTTFDDYLIFYYAGSGSLSKPSGASTVSIFRASSTP